MNSNFLRARASLVNACLACTMPSFIPSTLKNSQNFVCPGMVALVFIPNTWEAQARILRIGCFTY